MQTKYSKSSFILIILALSVSCAQENTAEFDDSDTCAQNQLLNDTTKTCVAKSDYPKLTNCLGFVTKSPITNQDLSKPLCLNCVPSYIPNLTTGLCESQGDSNCNIFIENFGKKQCYNCNDNYAPNPSNLAQCLECSTPGSTYIAHPQTCMPNCPTGATTSAIAGHFYLQNNTTNTSSIPASSINPNHYAGSCTEVLSPPSPQQACSIPTTCYMTDQKRPAASYLNLKVCTNQVCDGNCAEKGDAKKFCDLYANVPEKCHGTDVFCQNDTLNPYCISTLSNKCVPGCAPASLCSLPDLELCSSDNDHKSACKAGVDTCLAIGNISSGETDKCAYSLAPSCLHKRAERETTRSTYYTKELCTTCTDAPKSSDVIAFCSIYNNTLCLGANVPDKYTNKNGGIACSAGINAGDIGCRYYTKEGDTAQLYGKITTLGCDAAVLENFLGICKIVGAFSKAATCSNRTKQTTKPTGCKSTAGTPSVCGDADGPYYCGACDDTKSIDACTGLCSDPVIDNCYISDDNGCIGCNHGFNLSDDRTTCVPGVSVS